MTLQQYCIHSIYIQLKSINLTNLHRLRDFIFIYARSNTVDTVCDVHSYLPLSNIQNPYNTVGEIRNSHWIGRLLDRSILHLRNM